LFNNGIRRRLRRGLQGAGEKDGKKKNEDEIEGEF
jgi:hypothetical protein